MKKILLLLILIIPFMNSCKKESDKDEYMIYREIAWNYLGEQDKSSVIIDWKKAEVFETIYTPWPQAEGEELYPVPAFAVIFKTNLDALLGPITVYINPDNNEVLGIGLRD